MLNPFPDLLTYGFFAPTLLRLTVAAAFLFIAYLAYQRRAEIAQLKLPVIGGGDWVAYVSMVFHAVVGFMLGIGYYTQVAALLGVLAMLKGILLAKRYSRLYPLCRTEYALLLIICLSLLLSGAGALAYDLRL